MVAEWGQTFGTGFQETIRGALHIIFLGSLFKDLCANTITDNKKKGLGATRAIKGEELYLNEAKPETVEKVCDIVRKQLALKDYISVSGESKFAALGADSLDTVDIVMGPEEAFGITVEEESAQSFATVQDAADLIEKLCEKSA
ncbi:hypothetical protein L2E82_44087 [Cichorium intybus]|uniref:Uncharacterized protein n=1 Tax=Cichorium intybus TaxID=13427 RepID=A0ACB8ZR19_CICIN|nr:hypothetical protein L2E82_44087 [Cichorium intybus]